MWPNPKETADLVTFTEETLNGKLHFLYCALSIIPFYYSETVFAMHYLTLSRAGSQFIFLRYDGLIGDLGGKYRQEQERGGLFWVWFSKFSLK